jgi:hypothetical protein
MLRRPVEKAKGKATVSMDVADMEQLFKQVDEMAIELRRAIEARNIFEAALGRAESAVQQGWPGLVEEMGDVASAIGLISDARKLAEWQRRQPIDGSELVSRATLEQLAVLEPQGWRVLRNHQGPWQADNNNMTAVGSTPELMLRAIAMCTEECPVVHLCEDGKLKCECEEIDDSDHDQECPLSRHNHASFAYAQEIGQL